MNLLEEIAQELDKGAPWVLYRQDLAAILRRVAACRQAAPVVDDARMARALEWVRDVAQGMPASAAKEHLPAIEEAIAAYDPSCGARTVRVDDAMVRDARYWRTLMANCKRDHIWHHVLPPDLTEHHNSIEAVLDALARAQGVQS